MANTTSAKKAHRQTVKRTLINRMRLTRVRTCIKKVEQAIQKQDVELANICLRNAQSEIMRAVNKNVISFNAASRKISRLSKKIKALKEAA